MTDPRITTSSLIGVGHVVGSIVSCSYYYQQLAKDARSHTRGVILEGQTLRNMVEGLIDRVTEDELRGIDNSPSFAGFLWEAGRVFGRSWDRLSQLEELLREPVERWNGCGTSLTWPEHHSEVENAVECLHRMKSTIEKRLSIDTVTSTRPFQRNPTELRERILDHNRNKKMPDEERLQVMIGWLDAPNPSSLHENVRKGRVDRTGAWLLDGAEFNKWQDSTNMAVLWMHGIPGCGKSVLTSSLIDHIHSFCADGQNATLAYFYFQFSDPGRFTADVMLRSLISQLSSSQQSPTQTLEQYAYKHFAKSRWPEERKPHYREGISQPSIKDLTSILRGITEELRQVFLIIDGLDECADQDCLHEIMKTILGWNVQKLHIFLSSRFDRKLNTILDCGKRQIVEVTPEAVANDMQSFIQNQLDTHPRLRTWRFSSPVVKASLAKGSQGVFPWVTSQIEGLAKCATFRDMWRSLTSLPRSQSATYTSVLARIDSLHWDQAATILLWLAISSQPLSLWEAAGILAIDFSTEDGLSFNPELRSQTLDQILHACPTLLTTRETTKWRYGTIRKITELRLAHHSLQEYLLSDAFGADLPNPLPFKTREEVHQFAAKICISYLLSLRQPLDMRSMKQWPLARHAARFWPHHYVRAGSHPELTKLALRLLAWNGNTEPYKNWCRLYDPTKPWRAPNFDRELFPDPLYSVSSRGLDSLLPRLLIDRANGVGKETPIHPSCLQSAAYKGHHRVVELLLKAGADPNASNDPYDCPLKAAAAERHNTVIELLLKHGANPDGSNNLAYDEGSPLLEACRSDNPVAVGLLMNAGASPNHYSQKGDYLNPLEGAASRGSKECMRLLLPKASRSTALRGLEMAARRCTCDEGMLKLFVDFIPDAVVYHAILLGLDDLASDLLDTGVIQMDIDRSEDFDAYRRTKDYSPGGTLYCACEAGNFEMAKSLVQEGIDPSTGDEEYGPSLAVAAYKGHMDIVELLIQNGCSLSDGDGFYGGPVQAAVLGDHLDVLELLVSSGASVNLPVGRVQRRSSQLPLSGSPLKAAISTKNKRLTAWLIDHGANCNYGGGLGAIWEPQGIESPLMVAAAQGDLRLVDRLLEAGAEINQRYEKFPMSPITALEAACENGQITVVERLLNSGAAIERPEGEGGDALPLFFAVRAGSLETVSLLLKKGVSPNALRDREKGQVTVLSQACKGVNASIVSALVEAGADVHRTSRCASQDELPIQTAARRSNAEVVRVLLKHGAKINKHKELHTAIWKGKADMLRILLSDGQANPSLRLVGGSRPLHYAAKWNRPACLRVLVEAGADINSQDDSGKTPLHWAIEHGRTDALQWLLDNGADSGLTEKENNLTPYSYAKVRVEKAQSWEREEANEILRLLS